MSISNIGTTSQTAGFLWTLRFVAKIFHWYLTAFTWLHGQSAESHRHISEVKWVDQSKYSHMSTATISKNWKWEYEVIHDKLHISTFTTQRVVGDGSNAYHANIRCQVNIMLPSSDS